MPNPKFEVHLEDWGHALYPPEAWPRLPERIVPLTYEILTLLTQHEVTATFYVLGDVAARHPRLIRHIREAGHRIGSHGYFHRHNEHEGDDSDWAARQVIGGEVVGYRSPFWDTTPRPGYATGFFFRVLPYQAMKSELLRTGVLAIHPHDLDAEHPETPQVPLRRLLWVKGAKTKLRRVLDEVKFDAAR